MYKTVIIMLIAVLSFSACRMPTGQKETPGKMPAVEAVVIDDKTNIHYTGQFCNECHEKTPVEGGDPYLKFNGDYQRLCRCHHGMSPGYCHPIEFGPETLKKMPVPKAFPIVNGKFTCNTCHDVHKQCRKRLFDRQSLRGAPYPMKTDFCYNCHNKKAYRKLDAHHQLLPDGKPDVRMCLYCHATKPDEKTATYKEVSFIGDIKDLCRRCHQIAGNHAGNFDHIGVKPSDKVLKRMDAEEKKYNMILPLTKDGKLTCITCHNPHQKGVIPADKPSAKGADSKYRQRLPGMMCQACHQI